MDRKPLTDKLLVLGVDGMDAKTARRMVDEGKMPHLKYLLDHGCAREDLTQLGCIPTITPPCWTSLATGAYPGTHGITCYWRQSPKSLDAVVYNMDSRNCKAEQIWNVTAEAGKKTLVWHWPGSSWPPSSDSPNLSVVDGTQPGSVNMGVAQMDWEKVIVAQPDIDRVRYAPRVEKPAGVGCVINDLDAVTGGDDDDEMMELWWGDKAREGDEIRTYVMGFEDLHNLERGALDKAHVHKVTAQRALAVKFDDGGALAHLNVSQCLHLLVPLSPARRLFFAITCAYEKLGRRRRSGLQASRCEMCE